MQMQGADLNWDVRTAREKVLGYLNFSSGASDASFLAAIDFLYERTASAGDYRQRLAALHRELQEALAELRGSNSAFRDVSQAQAVIDLLFCDALPAYWLHHQDLLSEEVVGELITGFFLGRFWECLLREGGPWSERHRIVQGALQRINDFVGLRPVATLETQKCQPYAHEWFRPIPIYIRGAGVARCNYRTIVAWALWVLARLPEQFTRFAQFDLNALDELAVDPRPYDFDHPASKAPNHYFGMWDPHLVDNHGRYRRFVVHRMILDALLARVETTPRRAREDLEVEAGVALAGTILMASSTCGGGPNAFPSTVTLAQLIPQVAAHRDAFYDYCLRALGLSCAQYLQREARRLQQPFGGVRQHLNRQIARRRAEQLARLQVARVFLRLGLLDAATEQVARVGTASARMLCRLECAVRRANQALDAGQLEAAAAQLPEIWELVKRGIQCGALVDPWNILGMAAQFPVFGAADAIYDHRVEDLIRIVQQMFALATRIWTTAAASDQRALVERARHHFRQIADWWRQYAAHESTHVEAPNPDAAYASAERVAEALARWHQGGTATSRVGFWAEYVDLFPAPDAYAYVISTLLDRRDLVAAQALLIHWLSRHNEIALGQGTDSLPTLAVRWMLAVANETSAPGFDDAPARWRQARRFLELLEANAEELWQVPRWQEEVRDRSDPRSRRTASPRDEDDSDEDSSDIYRAAYEDVVYVDQTDDGIDSSLADVPSAQPADNLPEERAEIRQHLLFLRHLARLWKVVAIHPGFAYPDDSKDKAAFFQTWLEQADQWRVSLVQLAQQILSQPLPAPLATIEGLTEYDRQRTARDALVELVLETAVDMGEAVLWFRSALGSRAPHAPARDPSFADKELALCGQLLYELRYEDRTTAQRTYSMVENRLRTRPLLYVPVARGGDPALVAAARLRRRIVEVLLIGMSRRGLLRESCRLLEIARQMDRVRPVGAGAVTEYDELFDLGVRSIVSAVLAAFAPAGNGSGRQPLSEKDSSRLMTALNWLRRGFYSMWLAHSQSLRLSIVEHFHDPDVWREVRSFIRKYGSDLFTQTMMAFGNIRGILHRGVDTWLRELQQQADTPPRLVQDIDKPAVGRKATRILTLILEAVCENYAEYRDYNSTTTQSDAGDKLFVLLDFLRLQARFHRLWWDLRPMMIIHELLVRHGRSREAEALAETITEEANVSSSILVRDVRNLQRRYAVEMATVAHRILAKDDAPLLADRLKAMVEGLYRLGQNTGSGNGLLTEFQQLVETLLQMPCGAGFEMPEWLEAIDAEVDRLLRPAHLCEDHDLIASMWPMHPVSISDVRQQLGSWNWEAI